MVSELEKRVRATSGTVIVDCSVLIGGQSECESAGMAANLCARRDPLANGSSPAAAAVETVVTLDPRTAAESNVTKDKVLSSAPELSKRPTVVVASSPSPLLSTANGGRPPPQRPPRARRPASILLQAAKQERGRRTAGIAGKADRQVASLE